MRPRTWLLKWALIFLCVITVLVIFVVNSSPTNMKNVRKLNSVKVRERTKPHRPIQKLFHLDLKGAPPKMQYILQILPLVKRAGATGLLIEYEDMFPWHGMLKNISALNSYTRQEIFSLLETAKNLQLDVIPLVQTFGHLEFVLKLAEFRHLRELDSFPQEVCPSNSEAVHLIKEMIRQIMEIHTEAKYIHIGCDEVYHIAACSTCSLRNGRSIFIKHVSTIADYIKSTYDVRVIIWDDMLRHWSPADIESSELGKLVELMVWVYIEDIPRLVPHYIWYVYKKSFPKLWTASAFKGAYGEQELIPDLPRHVENHLAWMHLMMPNSDENTVLEDVEFQGIALTGWSRYDHFAVLAELLPIAMPSLILNMALVEAYSNSKSEQLVEAQAFAKMNEIMKCPKQLAFNSLEEMKRQKFQWMFGSCSYPGSSLYPLIGELFTLQARLNFVLSQKNSNGWVTEYNIRHNYTSPWRVLSLFPEEGFAALNIKKALVHFRSDLMENLKLYYDNYTVSEWIEQKIYPMEVSLNGMEQTFQKLIEIKTWPRRPFNYLSQFIVRR